MPLYNPVIVTAAKIEDYVVLQPGDTVVDDGTTRFFPAFEIPLTAALEIPLNTSAEVLG